MKALFVSGLILISSYAFAGNYSCGAYATGVQSNAINYAVRTYQVATDIAVLQDSKLIEGRNERINLNTSSAYKDLQFSIIISSNPKAPIALEIKPKQGSPRFETFNNLEETHELDMPIQVKGKAVHDLDFDDLDSPSSKENDNYTFMKANKAGFTVDSFVLSCLDCNDKSNAYKHPNAYNLICSKVKKAEIAESEEKETPLEKNTEY